MQLWEQTAIVHLLFEGGKNYLSHCLRLISYSTFGTLPFSQYDSEWADFVSLAR